MQWTRVKDSEKEYAESRTFKKFDIRDAYKDSKNFRAMIVAMSGMGKTVILRDLMFQVRDWFTECYIFSQTAAVQPDMYDFSDNITAGFDEHKLKEIYDIQKESHESSTLPKKKRPYILIIFDDLINNKEFINSRTAIGLWVHGRHYNISCVALSQYYKSIVPTIRNNCNLLICFKIINEDDQNTIVESYLSTDSKGIGRQIIRKITNIPYQALIVNTLRISYDPEDYISTYIANPDIKKFYIGKKKEKATKHKDPIKIEVQSIEEHRQKKY